VEHSYWSASKFEADMLCPGKHVLEGGAPDNTNQYSAEGTAAHLLLTWALQEERPASAYIGRVIHINAEGRVCDEASATYTFPVDEDMAGYVQTTIDYALAARGDDGVLMADIRVNYAWYLGVPADKAWGTADIIVCRGSELTVIDLKYGRGVEVDAERNPQMSLYGLGAFYACQDLVGEFDRVRMVISQPRVRSAPSEWDCSVAELEAWAAERAVVAVLECNAAFAAFGEPDNVWQEAYLRPGEKQCKFCRVKATCPALRDEVAATVFDSTPASPEEFAQENPSLIGNITDDWAPWLSAALSKADLIEDWVKAVRAEAERRLLAGDPVPGFKLVAGKKGNRQWADEEEVDKLMKTMRLKREDMYSFKLISPTSAEKLAKAGTIGPRQWPRLKALITQSDGKPHVAPESDSRPAMVVTPVIEEFTDLTAEPLA
jgi:hypothetical protein